MVGVLDNVLKINIFKLNMAKNTVNLVILLVLLVLVPKNHNVHHVVLNMKFQMENVLKKKNLKKYV
jgi:hypothetical protein